MKNSPQKFQLSLFALLLAFILVSCNSENFNLQRNQDFNLEWKFMIADIEQATEPEFDDSGWNAVDLPHDWGIEDFEVQDSLHQGPFYKDQAGGADIGYLRTGTCWYRKTWESPKYLDEKQVILNFDGVQTQMELWVNNKMVGEHVYGYTPFNFNVTEFLNAGGQDNIIAVKTVNSGENSR